MNIAFLADIHGNYEALNAVLVDLEKQNVDQLVVLGDLVFKGPQPQECVSAIQQLNVPTIRGNIDELVGMGQIQAGFAQSEAHEQALLTEMDWTRAQLTVEQLSYLQTLPLKYEQTLLNGLRLRCVHATPQSVLTSILPNALESEYELLFEANKDGESPDIVVYAHIHLPYVRSFNGKVIINCGSVGLTFDGDPRASYAMIRVNEQGVEEAVIRRVGYDIQKLEAVFHERNHPFANSVWQAMVTGRKPL
jgi:predicted phosphodiesterase